MIVMDEVAVCSRSCILMRVKTEQKERERKLMPLESLVKLHLVAILADKVG